jgi:hypothetical protein
MWPASSPSRKAIRAATSATVPTRPTMLAAPSSALRSSLRVPPMMSVSMGPGATQFTVIPCGPSSRASARVKPMIAALEAL